MAKENMNTGEKVTGEKYVVFASDLFLYHGGVSDYTDNFSAQLSLRGKLDYVVTPFGKNESSRYEVKKFDIPLERKSSRLDRFKPISKLRTFRYYFGLYAVSLKRFRQMNLTDADTILFPDYYSDRMDTIIDLTKKLKIPYGIIFHGLDLIWASSGKFRHFPGNLRSARFIIFNSNATASLYARLFPNLPAPKSTVIHPGVDVESIRRETLVKGEGESEDQGTIVLSTVSRLAARKGIDIAIHIVNNLLKRGYKVRYYIGGVGDEMTNLQSIVTELGLQEVVVFLGAISNGDKYSLLKRSDIFLLPNHSLGNSDFEGFGISFIEASLFGNLVIGGRHGGASEAVSDGETGYLFDFDIPSAVTEATDAIVNCIERPDLMDTIKRKGVEYVQANYDWKILIEKFLQWDDRV
jgi:glycosyltransferase involved in cell wall biosynthesis